jgi:hypothetical protein
MDALQERLQVEGDIGVRVEKRDRDYGQATAEVRRPDATGGGVLVQPELENRLIRVSAKK